MSKVDENTKPKTRAPRRNYRHPIGVLIRGHYQICDSLVLSENGILFALLDETTIEMGSLLVCTLIMPHGVNLVLRSNVVYQKRVNTQMQIGAGFVDIDMASRRKIRSYVAGKTIEEAKQEAIERAQ